MTEIDLLTKVINLLKKDSNLKTRYQSTIRGLEIQLAQAKLDRYRVGVIGVTSSGKSTMINSILGDDLLCMAVKPSSSQLVTCSKSDKKKATVFFEDKPPKEYSGKELTYEIIQKYSDENYNQKNKEHVKQLELSTPYFALPEEILLVDSPGLDAYGLEGHERLTMTNLLPTIDFCIFVTTFKTNSDEKMKSVLNTIADYDCPVIIVQNMLDSVKPSPDGKKSSIDVANEHKTRVERIINHSNIRDKSSVRIVQISSKLALEGRLEKNSSKIKKSNYKKLVDAVTYTLGLIKPKIESKRNNALKKRIDDLISEAKQDISSDATVNRTLKFEFAGLDLKISEEYDTVSEHIERTIGELAEYFVQLNDGNNSNPMFNEISKFSSVANQKKKISSFTENDMKQLKSKVSNIENILVSQMQQFNGKISEYCRTLGVDERRLRVVESFGELPELSVKKHAVKRLREKKGFFGGIARFFGNIANKNWGYEEYTVNEYDEKATRKAAQEYLFRVTKLYSESSERWLKNSESVVKELIGEVDFRKQAFEARQIKIADEKSMLSIIKGLEEIVRAIPEVKHDLHESIKHSETDMELKLVEMELPAGVRTIYDYAEKYRLKFHEQVVKSYGIYEQDTNVIISWDAFCTTALMKNWFGVNFSDEQFENGITQYKNTHFLNNPIAGCVSYIASKISARKINWIVLFNATQYGSALKSLSAINIEKAMRREDNLFLVAQDFEELRNGNGVKDGLKNMMNICSELGISKKAMIALNDNNPIYSIAALQSQRVKCVTQADEISMLGIIKERFSFMINPQSEKTIVDIIQALQ